VGYGGAWMGLTLGPGWAHVWAHCFFIFINQGGQLVRLGKSMIYRDLSIEADELLPSVNPFCPP
jgi:hypothetical protein